MFYDVSTFSFTPTLEAGWRDVLGELEGLDPQSFMEWPERSLYNQGWDAFGFYFLGRRFDENCRRCPRTAALVEQIPGLLTAGFSCLQPGTAIAPHVGYSHSLLVGHLALIVPDGCAIRVGPETRGWEPGKVMVFNDMVEHEAWNRGTSRRVVLLFEFLKPGATLDDLTMSEELQESLGDLG